MKTCIFGGTFDPVHYGHINLALNAKKLIKPDKMLIIPSFIPPHKNADLSSSSHHRLEMAKIAADMVGCEVSDIEIKRNDVSFSVYTLEQLKKDGYGDIYFIMGADMCLCIEKWYEFKKVLSLMTIVTAPRRPDEYEILVSHAKHLKEAYNANCIVGDFEVMEVSSTFLREKIKNNEDVSEYIPEKIFEYIDKNRLYGIK